MNDSVKAMWEAYLQSIGEDPASSDKTFTAWHFCDNQQDANELAELVKRGLKRATASSLWAYEHDQQSIPKAGDLSVILGWNGRAQCIIRTSQVDIVPFEDVTAAFARAEGEGDRSLDHWRRGYWGFFTRELKALGREPDPRMPVVCERFEVVFPRVQ